VRGVRCERLDIRSKPDASLLAEQLAEPASALWLADSMKIELDSDSTRCLNP
jgi:hypothetical protein